MKSRRIPDTLASPPDDAGHRGAFTVPFDTMEVSSAELELPAPDLAADTTHRRVQPRRGELVVALGMMALIIAMLSWLIYGASL